MAEKPSSEPRKYSRESITGPERRQVEAQDIRNKEGDKKSTVEGRTTLSQEWLKRAWLSEGQTQAINNLLGIESSDTPQQREDKIKRWQSENGLQSDGILGWGTLEALDNKIEERDRAYDKDNTRDKIEEWYGLARVGYHEKKNNEQAQQEAKEKKAMEDLITRAKEEKFTHGVESPFWDQQVLTPQYNKNGEFEHFQNEAGEIYNIMTGKFEAQTSTVATTPEKTEDTEIKIWDLVIREWEWGKRTINTGWVWRNQRNIEEQLTRHWEQVISYKDGKYSVANIKDGQLWTFKQIEYQDLPQDFQQKNNQKIAQEVVEKYWDMQDWELIAPNVEVSKLKLGDLWRGTEVDGDITPEAAARIKFLQERLAPMISTNSNMKEITLWEYVELSENPDLFATSRLMKEKIGRSPKETNKKWFIDPNKYGIPSEFEYAATSSWATIKRPKSNANLETIMIAGKGWKYESQKDWLQRVEVTPDKEYVVYGMQDMRFKKTIDGNITVYRVWWENAPQYTYRANDKTWKATESAV